jgi:hypothetical protein
MGKKKKLQSKLYNIIKSCAQTSGCEGEIEIGTCSKLRLTWYIGMCITCTLGRGTFVSR